MEKHGLPVMQQNWSRPPQGAWQRLDTQRASAAPLAKQVLPGGQHGAPGPPQQPEAPHTEPGPQALLHRVQFCALVVRLISQPSTEAPLQLSQPALQEAMRQLELMQAAVAWAKAQARPQPPQLAASPRVSTSQPSAAIPLQSAKPELHSSMAQAPLTQAPRALRGAQAAPHAPQWEVFEPRLTSQPLPALPSQLPRPGAHDDPQAPPEQVAVALEKLQRLPQVPR